MIIWQFDMGSLTYLLVCSEIMEFLLRKQRRRDCGRNLLRDDATFCTSANTCCKKLLALPFDMGC